MVKEALDWYLDLFEFYSIMQDVPNPQICPFCLRSCAIVPVLTEHFPVYVDVGHASDCQVLNVREEAALRRRLRWEHLYAKQGVKQRTKQRLNQHFRDSSRIDNLDRLDEFLSIVTQFPTALQNVGDRSKWLPPPQNVKVEPMPLDKGTLTLEAQSAYKAIRNHLQTRYRGRKATEVRNVRGSHADPKEADAFLRLVRRLPDPKKATPLEVKAVFLEVIMGRLEFAHHEFDGKRPLHEYAKSQLARPVIPLTPEQRKELEGQGWQDMLCVRKAQPRPLTSSRSNPRPYD